MARVTRFEDLICWQKARELTRQIYLMANSESVGHDFRFRSQITSASVSIMSNIAEGFGRFHKKDFAHFLDIAQSSAAEVMSLLYVAEDLGYSSELKAQELRRLTDECRATTIGLLHYVKESIDRGSNIGEPTAPYVVNFGDEE